MQQALQLQVPLLELPGVQREGGVAPQSVEVGRGLIRRLHGVAAAAEEAELLLLLQALVTPPAAPGGSSGVAPPRWTPVCPPWSPPGSTAPVCLGRAWWTPW